MSVESQTLVVTDPPHGPVDVAAAAALLGLSTDDFGPKVAFWAPEVMSASDPDEDAEIAQTLQRLGMSVALIDAARLATVPWPGLVDTLEFRSEGLLARLVSGADRTRPREVEISYEQPIFVVHCKPPEGFVPPEVALQGPQDDGSPHVAEGASGHEPPERERSAAAAARPPRGLSVAEAVQWSETLDLYVESDGRPERLTLAPEITRVSAGTSTQLAQGADELATAMLALQTHFRRLSLDARLRDVWPRQRFKMGASGFDLDLRKAFSYGTLLLRQALQSASEELGDLPQFELGSRMAYLLAKRPPSS